MPHNSKEIMCFIVAYLFGFCSCGQNKANTLWTTWQRKGERERSDCSVIISPCFSPLVPRRTEYGYKYKGRDLLRLVHVITMGEKFSSTLLAVWRSWHAGYIDKNFKRLRRLFEDGISRTLREFTLGPMII